METIIIKTVLESILILISVVGILRFIVSCIEYSLSGDGDNLPPLTWWIPSISITVLYIVHTLI